MALIAHWGRVGFVIGLMAAAAAPVFAGSILKAACPCGYHLEILAGGGMANFRTFCAAPAYCPASKQLEILNYLEEAPKCKTGAGTPVFYNDPSLQEKLPEGAKPRIVFSWNTDNKGTFVLPDVAYFCPQCGKMRLHFTHTGMWD